MTGDGTVQIFRFDPSVDKEPRFETYEVPVDHWQGVKVIDTLRYLYETRAPGLSFREPCRQQVCGACAMLVNKKPVLACDAFSEQEMIVEPLPHRKVLKDLITESGEEGGS
jgi:succinate dehydrogenase / fumarate reductase, iron-sulfur subunit